MDLAALEQRWQSISYSTAAPYRSLRIAADCSPMAIIFMIKRTSESICPMAFICSGELFCEMYFNAKMTNTWAAPVNRAMVKILLSIKLHSGLSAKIAANR